MTKQEDSLENLHWQHDLLGSIEVGIVVLDSQYRVKVWNRFMENHSGILPSAIKDGVIFDHFSEIDKDWFCIKADTVYSLGSPAFIIWEQRPYLFRFGSNRPVTSASSVMFQNITMFPLASLDNKIEHMCLVVYDVTDEALSKKHVHKLNEKLETISRVDGLTQVYNRRYFDERLDDEFKRIQRTKGNACAIMLDIDHFKKVNDTYGHPTGDQVIKALANEVKNSIRETDLCGRYGGEEFAVYLLDTDRDGGELVAERIRQACEALTVTHEDNEVTFTISVGLCSFHESYTNAGQWLERADQFLYEAKEGGRNQVVTG